MIKRGTESGALLAEIGAAVRVRTCWPASLNPVLPDLSRSDSSPCAEAFSSELDILNVVQSSDIEHPEQLLRLQQHFYGAVEAILPHDASQICQPHTFVRVGKPHADILKHIEEREIDLLILGLHRNTHLGMQNRTSGAFPIIVKAKCPVVTVARGATS